MTKIKNMEMAKAIAAHPEINITRTFFSLRESVVYEPTGSPVALYRQDYEQAEGNRLARLLAMPADRMARDLQERGVPKSVAIGNYRLEAALSEDKRFMAVQLFQFADFKYRPVTEALFFEGEDAAKVSGLL